MVLILVSTIGMMFTATPLYSQEHRNAEQVKLFHTQTGFPNGRKGYVVDHIIPFCYGGSSLDSTWNYQWQRLDSSYTKNKYEVELCRDKITFTQYEFLVKSQHLAKEEDFDAALQRWQSSSGR